MNKRFTCNLCWRPFPKYQALRMHYFVHSNVKRYECDICHKSFARNNHLTRHKKALCDNLAAINKSKSKRFSCDRCNKQFTRGTNLRRHQTQKLCDKYIKEHENSTANEESFECNQCREKFEGLAVFKKHFFSHSGLKSYECPFCRDVFESWHLRADHKKEKHPKQKRRQRSICYVCGKVLSSNSSLITHLKYHTGVKPFQCAKCNLSFIEASSLRKHDRTHSGERPYSCHICGKGFKQAAHLAEHVRAHVGEKPFVCPICGKRWISKTRLQGHVWQTHRTKMRITNEMMVPASHTA